MHVGPHTYFNTTPLTCTQHHHMTGFLTACTQSFTWHYMLIRSAKRHAPARNLLEVIKIHTVSKVPSHLQISSSILQCTVWHGALLGLQVFGSNLSVWHTVFHQAKWQLKISCELVYTSSQEILSCHLACPGPWLPGPYIYMSKHSTSYTACTTHRCVYCSDALLWYVIVHKLIRKLPLMRKWHHV